MSPVHHKTGSTNAADWGASPAPAAPAQPLYEELLFSVGNKHPGETRHQTALRYIRQAESAGIAASKGESK